MRRTVGPLVVASAFLLSLAGQALADQAGPYVEFMMGQDKYRLPKEYFSRAPASNQSGYVGFFLVLRLPDFVPQPAQESLTQLGYGSTLRALVEYMPESHLLSDGNLVKLRLEHASPLKSRSESHAGYNLLHSNLGTLTELHVAISPNQLPRSFDCTEGVKIPGQLHAPSLGCEVTEHFSPHLEVRYFYNKDFVGMADQIDARLRALIMSARVSE